MNNDDLISREDLKNHKFLTPQYKQLGGRGNGKTIELIDLIYQRGWNDAIDAICDNAPTVEERPQGEWIIEKNTRDIICSCCGQSRRDTRTNHVYFCNHCGAKMKKEANND